MQGAQSREALRWDAASWICGTVFLLYLRTSGDPRPLNLHFWSLRVIQLVRVAGHILQLQQSSFHRPNRSQVQDHQHGKAKLLCLCLRRPSHYARLLLARVREAASVDCQEERCKESNRCIRISEVEKIPHLPEIFCSAKVYYEVAGGTPVMNGTGRGG